MIRRVLYILVAILFIGSVAGCFSVPKPANIVLSDFKWEETSLPGTWKLTGIAQNVGDVTASYVEIGVKLFNAEGVVVATGWTNLVNIRGGEKRAFTIWVNNVPAEGWARSEVVWSFNVGGAMN